MENTFDVDNMNKDESTRIIVKTKFNDGDDFYAIGTPGSDYEESVYIPTTSPSVTAQQNVIAAILDVLKGSYPAIAEAEEQYNSSGSVLDIALMDETSHTTSLSKSCNDAYITVKLVTGLSASDFKDVENGSSAAFSALSALTMSDVETTINKELNVVYYKGGICYYPVIISHFGDELTPWEEIDLDSAYPETGSYASGNSIGSDGAEGEWLGRWGVLRNNWYDIEITDVQKLGYPTVPPAPEEEDDDVLAWLKIKINVLSWGYRSNSVSL